MTEQRKIIEVSPKSLAVTHPQLAALWGDNGPLTPAHVTAGSHKKVRWRCAEGHTWEAMVTAVTAGTGCPYCAGKRAVPGVNDLRTLRPDLMAQWDPERNTLDPAALLPSAHDKVWWRCSLGHQWQAAVFSRTREKAAGCPYCAGKKVLPGFNDLRTLRPDLADQWLEGPNGPLTPETVSPGSNKKVWWRCPDGHVWQAAVYSRTRTRAAGCPVCAGTVRGTYKRIELPRRPRREAPAAGMTANL